MTLREKRCLFSRLICEHLCPYITSLGYEYAIDEWTEHLTDKDPTSDHGAASWHHQGLAVDINLYKDGVYLSSGIEHMPIGEYWKGLHEDCTFGGDFGDPNHYSWGEK